MHKVNDKFVYYPNFYSNHYRSKTNFSYPNDGWMGEGLDKAT